MLPMWECIYYITKVYHPIRVSSCVHWSNSCCLKRILFPKKLISTRIGNICMYIYISYHIYAYKYRSIMCTSLCLHVSILLDSSPKFWHNDLRWGVWPMQRLAVGRTRKGHVFFFAWDPGTVSGDHNTCKKKIIRIHHLTGKDKP